MLTREAKVTQLCSTSQSCECSFVSNNVQSYSDGLFLMGGLGTETNMKLQQSALNHNKVTNKGRKSLKPRKSNKQNQNNEGTTIHFNQKNTCSSGKYFKNQNSQLTIQKTFAQKYLPRNSSSALTNYLSDSAGNSNIMVKKQRQVEVKKQMAVVNRHLNQFSTQNRLAQNTNRVVMAQRANNIDRVQSSQNLIASRQIRQAQLPRSQFVNIELDKSVSKMTNKLTDLNFKCTQSINDSQSLRISEVISDSDSSLSGSNRTETFPRRIKDLMHIKYSKIEGKRY